MPARRPRSSTAATRSRPTSPPRASSRRSHRPRPLRACGAPAGCYPPNDALPTFFVIAPIPNLWPRFPPFTRSGWPDGLSLPRSSRRNAPRGPNSSRSLRLRFAAAPRGLVQSCYPRGRRGGFAAHGAGATGLYYGPRYAVIWHADAHQLTPPPGPRDEALRNSATPTVGSRLGM